MMILKGERESPLLTSTGPLAPWRPCVEGRRRALPRACTGDNRFSPSLTVDLAPSAGFLRGGTAVVAATSVRSSLLVVNVSRAGWSFEDHGTPGSLLRFLLGGMRFFTTMLDVANWWLLLIFVDVK